MKKKSSTTVVGQKLIAAMKEAIEIEKGNAKPGRVTHRVLIQDPPKWSPDRIKDLRRKLELSQSMLANLLAVATETVCAWEQGVNIPSGIARRTLQLLALDPEIITRLPKAS